MDLVSLLETHCGSVINMKVQAFTFSDLSLKVPINWPSFEKYG